MLTDATFALHDNALGAIPDPFSSPTAPHPPPVWPVGVPALFALILVSRRKQLRNSETDEHGELVRNNNRWVARVHALSLLFVSYYRVSRNSHAHPPAPVHLPSHSITGASIASRSSLTCTSPTAGGGRSTNRSVASRARACLCCFR